METEIYSMAFGGDGVGKVDGKVCFVKGAIPPEKVLFDVTKETSSYIKGDLVRVLSSSPDRVEPACRYYNKCGGCQLQHVSYEKELFYKREQVIELIKRIAGKEEFECAQIVASPDCYHYRSSVTLHKKGEKYGYFAGSSSPRGTIIEIEECPITNEAINKELSGLMVEGGREELTLKSDYKGSVWSSEKPGERFFLDRYGDVEMYFSPRTFSQANRYISEKMAEKLGEWIGEVPSGAAFFDVYCGVGFFSFLLKQDFEVRAGMDSSKKKNLQNMKFYRGDVEKEFLPMFERLKKGLNVLLLDPPRKGTGRDFLDKIKIRDDINKMYYISCDPARLARDVKVIEEGSKWSLGKVAVFDMFPRTKHIEAMVEFIKGGYHEGL
ncbi:MAG: class I SAM-dependent RNA methyltransferase [Candidatus Omnitrophota bacterium]